MADPNDQVKMALLDARGNTIEGTEHVCRPAPDTTAELDTCIRDFKGKVKEHLGL